MKSLLCQKLLNYSKKQFLRIQATLFSEKLNFHTFTIPLEKEVKVVLKDIPYTTLGENIINDLDVRLFSPTSCAPITNDQKKAVNTFLISLKEHMFQLKVTVENYKAWHCTMLQLPDNSVTAPLTATCHPAVSNALSIMTALSALNHGRLLPNV